MVLMVAQLRRRLVGMVIAIAFMPITMLAVDVLDTRPTSELAAAWAAANAGRLPDTLDELSSLSVEYRHEVVKRLPAQTKGTLWSEQIARFLAKNPTLQL